MALATQHCLPLVLVQAPRQVESGCLSCVRLVGQGLPQPLALPGFPGGNRELCVFASSRCVCVCPGPLEHRWPVGLGASCPLP